MAEHALGQSRARVVSNKTKGACAIPAGRNAVCCAPYLCDFELDKLTVEPHCGLAFSHYGHDAPGSFAAEAARSGDCGLNLCVGKALDFRLRISLSSDQCAGDEQCKNAHAPSNLKFSTHPRSRRGSIFAKRKTIDNASRGQKDKRYFPAHRACCRMGTAVRNVVPLAMGCSHAMQCTVPAISIAKHGAYGTIAPALEDERQAVGP